MKKFLKELFSFKALKNQDGFAALTPTYPLGSQGISTEFGGANRLFIFTVTLTTNTDTLTLVRAADKIGTIIASWAVIKTGTAAGFGTLEVTFTGLVITIKSYNAAGSVATTFGDVNLFVIGQ